MRSPDRVRAASVTAGRVAQGGGRDKHLAGRRSPAKAGVQLHCAEETGPPPSPGNKGFNPIATPTRIGQIQGERMNRSSLCTALAAAALLCACDRKAHSDESENAS